MQIMVRRAVGDILPNLFLDLHGNGATGRCGANHAARTAMRKQRRQRMRRVQNMCGDLQLRQQRLQLFKRRPLDSGRRPCTIGIDARSPSLWLPIQSAPHGRTLHRRRFGAIFIFLISSNQKDIAGHLVLNVHQFGHPVILCYLRIIWVEAHRRVRKRNLRRATHLRRG